VTQALVIAFGAVAIADWVVAFRADRRVRPVTKTAATGLLVAIAASAGDMEGDARAALVAAVVLCLIGDVALLDDRETRFLAGLGAFALGHGAYVATALFAGVSWPRLAVAFPFLAVVLGVQAITGMLPGARRAGGVAMMAAVALYSAIISAMVVTASGTSCWLAAAGAMLFAVSDSIIGYHRFVKPVPRSDVAVMTTYHGGQVLLILGLVAAG
jgi:uncharacterized membrane protein YhhN